MFRFLHQNAAKKVRTGFSQALILPGILGVAMASTAVQAGMITEDFTGNVFDTNNFEQGGNNGAVVDEAWRSATDRGTLRTVAPNLNPTALTPLKVTAELTFRQLELAFLAVRSNGLPGSGPGGPDFYEPVNSLFLRFHNFQMGKTEIALLSPFNALTTVFATDAFFANPVRVSLMDDGSTLDVSMENLVTNAVVNLSANSGDSFGGHVAFSGSGTSSWDNISIMHANVPEPATLALMGLGLVGIGYRRHRHKKAV